MAEVRSLLQMGNGKVGRCISTWSLPAGKEATCVGESPVCSVSCYAKRSRFTLPSVKERLAWNLEEARKDTFAGKLVKEIRRKGHLVVRVHVSGDFFDECYALKWLEVMRACPKARYYWYSRSWVRPDIAKVLEQMAQLRQCVGWYSVDASMKLPERLPPGIRLAYLQAEADEEPTNIDLLFRVKRLRRERVPLSLACPSEKLRGDITCGSCARCFTK